MQSRSLLAFGRRVLRSRPGLRLGLAVLCSIAVIEAAILIPSTRNFERDQLQRLSDIGRAAARMAPIDLSPAAGTRSWATAAQLLEQTGVCRSAPSANGRS
jgi:hypothetical protein